MASLPVDEKYMFDTKQFVSRIKYVKAKDLLSVFPMMIGFFSSIFFRIKHKNIWLICERENEARDNGYWFFKYVCEKHPDIEAVYAINKNGIDYHKVKELGRIIQFGSLKHWIYYFAAEKNISSQKEGKPNAALCFFIEIYLGARNNRYFLQHGIINNSLRWLFYDISKYQVFCVSAEREREYVVEEFAYPESAVKLTGLCRYDNLMSNHKVKRQVLVMPTMRDWLARITSETIRIEGSDKFEDSFYYKTWNHFLRSELLKRLLEEKDINLVFYIHPNLQKYIDRFVAPSSRMTIASYTEYEMQSLLMESSVLITDYSSIFFDFAYMRKPLIYYQFDYKQFRQYHYQEGYFSYSKDGFGPVVEHEEDLLLELRRIIDNDCKTEEKYLKRSDVFFAFRDNRNCERVFEAINN